jgi:hypothetical protein
MNLLKELLTLTEGSSKRYIEDLIEKAIKLVDTDGMSYEDAVDTIADKVKELAQPDQQIVDTDMLIDMIKAVYDDELDEGANESSKQEFNNQKDWLSAVKKAGSTEISSWGHGSKSAHDDNGKVIGEWVAEFDCDNGQSPYGWIKTKKVNEDESMDDEPEPAEPAKPKLLGKAGDYTVMLDDDEEVCLYYEDKMITSMPLVIWKQLTKI